MREAVGEFEAVKKRKSMASVFLLSQLADSEEPFTTGWGIIHGFFRFAITFCGTSPQKISLQQSTQNALENATGLSRGTLRWSLH